jgi:hypothetical protein
LCENGFVFVVVSLSGDFICLAHATLGEHDKAISSCEKSLKLDLLSADVQYDLGRIYGMLGDCLLAFTDDVSEISGGDGKLLETEGFVRILDDVGYPESRDFKAVEEKLLKFSDRIRFNDDLTFLEIRFS